MFHAYQRVIQMHSLIYDKAIVSAIGKASGGTETGRNLPCATHNLL